MSVPPQQPGPHGQQPGQFGQQPGQFGQQPGYGQQPGGYPPPPQGFPQGGQQPGYGTPPGAWGQPGQPGQQGQPGPGQPGQPGYGQQPYGQPGQFNQPGYGQPGGFGDPYGAPRKKSPLPWILAGGGVLVIGIAALLFFVLRDGGGNSTAKGAAESFAAALTAKDFEKMRSLTCPEYQARVDDMRKLYDAEGQLDEIEKQLEGLPAEMREEAMKSLEAAKNIKFTATATDVRETSDTTAEATMTVKYENVPEDMKALMKDQEDTLYLDKTDDGWVACDK